MARAADWQRILDFWFPAGLDAAGPETHAQMFEWWFAGGANAEVGQFALLVEAGLGGHLDHWAATPEGRLALILLLDQFPRSLRAGTPMAYAGDPDALRIAEEGLHNGHYDTLAHPWERTFFFLPLGHAEGPDHRQRLIRVGAMAEAVAWSAPERLRPLYRFSADQARRHRAVVERFGRFPHRNAVLGRASSPEEVAYLATGELVHRRRPSPAVRLGLESAPYATTA